MNATPGPRLGTLVALFLKLGTIGFGGPAAHIALMREEVVERRKWLTEQRFLDLVGATNIIPGPNSTELAIHIGRDQAGRRGLVAAGAAFIAPAVVIVLALAWLYARFGARPEADSVLYGIAPVVIAVILGALWQLSRTAAKTPALAALGAIVFALHLAGLDELLLLLGAALVAGAARGGGTRRVLAALPPGALVAADAVPVELDRLFLLFLKFGSVVFGSGYVLLAFLRGDLVERLGWLTSEQLVDAIAVGQMTPGPVFTTATFIGYLVAGVPGALVATAGIFLPSFVFVALLNPLVAKMRESEVLGAVLDGLNAGAIGLMAGVTVQLARVALVDPLTVAIAVVSAVVIFAWRPNAAWLILAGALAGLARAVLT